MQASPPVMMTSEKDLYLILDGHCLLQATMHTIDC